MEIEELHDKLSDKLERLSTVATRTETKVSELKEDQKEQKEHCTKEMNGVYATLSGRGGHGERLATLETKWKLFSKRGLATGAGAGTGIAGILWLLFEVIIPYFTNKGGP